jgi:hypothetical protein
MAVGDTFAPIPLAGSTEKAQFIAAFLTRPRTTNP